MSEQKHTPEQKSLFEEIISLACKNCRFENVDMDGDVSKHSTCTRIIKKANSLRRQHSILDIKNPEEFVKAAKELLITAENVHEMFKALVKCGRWKPEVLDFCEVVELKHFISRAKAAFGGGK